MILDLSFSKLSKRSIKDIADKAAEGNALLHSGKMPMTNWVNLPENISEEEITRIEAEAGRLREISEAIVLVGIGGSYLGAKACFDFTGGLFRNERERVKFYFAGCNMSATYHYELAERLEGKDFSVIVVSKSGSTTETKAAYELFKGMLKTRYGQNYSKHIVVISEKDSAMHEQSKSEGLCFFEMDKNIGGRYSVLSCAGLFPICAMGEDIREIIAGARSAAESCSPCANPMENYAVVYAIARNLISLEYEKQAELFCFFEPNAEYFGQWLIQLFGESEGKQEKGEYPASLLFTRDLHSMGQFLQQGSPIFSETIISIQNPPHDLRFNEGEPTYNEYNEIITRSVIAAHEKTPIIHISFNDLSPYCFGEAVYFFEKACAVSAMLKGLNPFDQPGVETYKSEVRRMAKKYKEEDSNR